MGQRHQLYIRIKGKSGPIMLGYHHQWLFGKTAMQTLERVLTFASASLEDKYSPLNEPYDNGYSASNALESVISTDYKTGYHHGVCAFQHQRLDSDNSPDVLQNPMLGDNNNGITIVDLTGDKPKYCFMSLTHLECLDGVPSCFEVENLVPIDAETWINLHYPKDTKNVYYKDWPKAELVAHAKERTRLVKALSKYKALTQAEVKKMFPKMFKGVK